MRALFNASFQQQKRGIWEILSFYFSYLKKIAVNPGLTCIIPASSESLQSKPVPFVSPSLYPVYRHLIEASHMFDIIQL